MSKHSAKTLIGLFNSTFQASHNTVLVDSGEEPVYLPGKPPQLHKIGFAHGFFASALHETAHWCIAGAKRRELVDFGYWYQPDGRSAAQQKAFEQVEVKPQALEWIFSLAADFRFVVSVDNLSGEQSDNTSFKMAVYHQALQYLNNTMSKDAQCWYQTLLQQFRAGRPVLASELNMAAL